MSFVICETGRSSEHTEFILQTIILNYSSNGTLQTVVNIEVYSIHLIKYNLKCYMYHYLYLNSFTKECLLYV